MSQEERKYKSIESLELSLDRINAWISNCDQKAGILLATIGVMITVLFTTDFVDGVKNDIVSPFLNYLKFSRAYEFSLFRCLFFCFLVLVVIMCVETSFYSLKTISATTDSKSINGVDTSMVSKSYLFFQTIADMNYAEFKEFGGDEKYQDDLTSQIYINSKICAAKFAQYKIALLWFKRLVVCISIMFVSYLFV